MTLPLLAEVLGFCPKSLQPPYFRASLGQNIVNSQFWHYFCLKFWRSKVPRAWSTWTTQGEPKECRVKWYMYNVHCTFRNISGLKFIQDGQSMKTFCIGIKLFHLSQEPSELVSPVSSRSNKKFVKAGWLFRSGWLDGDHHHIYDSTTLIPCKEFKQFENPCSPYLHHFWLFSGRKYNAWFWWKSLPIEEAGLQKWWKVAMKIKLLVYCGEMLVEGLQLRKPAQDRVHELGIVLKKKKTFSMLTQ